MEIETVVRANLPIMIIIINNNGIYQGFDIKTYNSIPIKSLPSTALLPDVRYDLIADASGGKGYFVRTPKELGNALDDALLKLSQYKCVVINVMVQPQSEKTVNTIVLKSFLMIRIVLTLFCYF